MNLKYILAFFAIGVNVVLSDISHIRGAPSDEELEIIENNDLQGLELEEAPFQEEQLDLDVIHGRELGSKDGDKGSGGRRRNRPGKRPGKKRRRRRRRKHHSHKRKSGSRRRRKSRSRSRRRKSRSHYRRRRGRKYRRRRYYRRRSRKSTSSSSSSSRSYYPRSYYVTTRRNDGVMCVDFGDEFGWQTVGVEGEDMYWWMLNRANPKAIPGPCSDPDTDRLGGETDQDEEVWCREFGGGVWRTLVGEEYMEAYWLRNLAQAEGTCNLRSYGGEWTMTTL